MLEYGSGNHLRDQQTLGFELADQGQGAFESGVLGAEIALTRGELGDELVGVGDEAEDELVKVRQTFGSAPVGRVLLEGEMIASHPFHQLERSKSQRIAVDFLIRQHFSRGQRAGTTFAINVSGQWGNRPIDKVRAAGIAGHEIVLVGGIVNDFQLLGLNVPEIFCPGGVRGLHNIGREHDIGGGHRRAVFPGDAIDHGMGGDELDDRVLLAVLDSHGDMGSPSAWFKEIVMPAVRTTAAS